MADVFDPVASRVSRLLSDVLYNLQKDVVRVMLLAVAGVLARNMGNLVGRLAPQMPSPQLIVGAVALLASAVAMLLQQPGRVGESAPGVCAAADMLCQMGLRPPPAQPAPSRATLAGLSSHPAIAAALLSLLIASLEFEKLLAMLRLMSRKLQGFGRGLSPHLLRLFTLPSTPKVERRRPPPWKVLLLALPVPVVCVPVGVGVGLAQQAKMRRRRAEEAARRATDALRRSNRLSLAVSRAVRRLREEIGSKSPGGLPSQGQPLA